MLNRSTVGILLLTSGILCPFEGASAQGPGPGQILAAFAPELTGDPKEDFAKEVEPGVPFTVYLIVGRLDDSVSHYRFGLQISRAATIALQAIRAPGSVLAFQNSIGTFVFGSVDILNDCLEVQEERVIAEIELVLVESVEALTLNVAGWNGLQEPPQYDDCSNRRFTFDPSIASTLSLLPAGQVSVEVADWSMVKTLFR